MLSAAEIERRVTAVLEATSVKIAVAYLFGSVARGSHGVGSDVDVAVLFAERSPASLDSPVFVLQGDLERNEYFDLAPLRDAYRRPRAARRA